MIVADASMLVKLVVEEADSDKAREIFEDETINSRPVLVPDTALSECVNVLWKYCSLKKEISVSEFGIAAGNLAEVWSKLDVISTKKLLESAANISIQNRISFYDSLYLATCRFGKAKLATFDKPLKTNAEKIGLTVV